jgi:hypothetical protein
MASDEGSDQPVATAHVNLDLRHSSSAIGRGSISDPAHHDASSPYPWRSR